jgi:hypothetical protein
VDDVKVRALAKENNMEYFITSAQSGSNVVEMMDNIINQVYE